jgi:hypothetical protein
MIVKLENLEVIRKGNNHKMDRTFKNKRNKKGSFKGSINFKNSLIY